VISSLSPQIIGKNWKDLEKSWEDLPQAYLGITVPRYPNLFILLGPNTGLGHNSVVWMIECQVNYAVECLQEMIRTNTSAIEVKQEALDRYYEKLYNDLDKSIWDRSNCTSWYQTKAGKIFAIWPRSLIKYWTSTLSPNFDDYLFS